MAKRFNTVAKFAQSHNDSEKLVARMEDYARHYASEKMEGVKMSYDSTKSLSEKAKQINELFVEELARRSKYSKDDFDSVEEYATFGVVAQMGANIQKSLIGAVMPILLNSTNMAMLTEFHYGGYGDVFEFEIKDNSQYKVSKMGRRQKHTKTQESKKQNVTIGTDFYGISVYTTLPAIILGESMLAEDVMKMGIAMQKKLYTLTVKKFVAETEAVADAKFVIGGGYDEKTFLEKVRNASAINGGATMIIVGDTIALKSLLPSDSRTRILLQDEYNTTIGYMTSWNGYTVVGFDVVADEDETNGVLGLPTNRIYALPVNGTKMIHVAMGSTMTNADDVMDANDLTAVTTFRQEMGVELLTNHKPVICKLA